MCSQLAEQVKEVKTIHKKGDKKHNIFLTDG